ncbi:MAG: hypothetical protein EA359_06000 [Balneolaceae bacterium]|jgi:hypothetical protein|nr:MAG: hypothetical protein EA359_06000 [Balneolaceae bacterium]
MITLSEIKQMTKEEKLHLMETIWQHLSIDEEQLEVPQSHKKMLEQRAAMAEQGAAEFLDWQQAKKHINKAVQ